MLADNSANTLWLIRAYDATIDSQVHVGMEDLEQGVEVPVARSCEERVGDLPLTREIGFGSRHVLHPPAPAACKLLNGGLGPVKGSGDLGEPHAEHACSTNENRSAGVNASNANADVAAVTPASCVRC